MTINHKPKACSPENGDTRTITKFAFWPITAGYKTKWLETVTIRQRFSCGAYDCIYAEWDNIKFIEKDI